VIGAGIRRRDSLCAGAESYRVPTSPCEYAGPLFTVVSGLPWVLGLGLAESLRDPGVDIGWTGGSTPTGLGEGVVRRRRRGGGVLDAPRKQDYWTLGWDRSYRSEA
jgi:hypothetical protein